eukprot:TRINITY_DN487_c0_g1_i2.p1 TRINITY_DN487_c0_g1~~TRINITY_DN487_c0_g1_i2.p1  ORF type:complete len:402 (-),score=171.30 TRINITY_DN487_c0_g1_i2:97-1302(-)
MDDRLQARREARHALWPTRQEWTCLLKATAESARDFISERIGKPLTHKGITGDVTHFVVEPFIPHSDEYYVSITSEREANIIRFCAAGGIEIEEHWDRIRSVSLTIDDDIDNTDLSPLVVDIASTEPALAERPEQIMDFVRALYKVFVDLDFTMLEINPFTFEEIQVNANGDEEGTGAGPYNVAATTVALLDMRAELDTTAGFRNTQKWEDVEFPLPFGRSLYPEEQTVHEIDEKTGASLKLTVLNPKGRVWAMVAGGGASVIYADTVADLGFGAELGNYGEYSGNPSEDDTYKYASVIIDLCTRNPSATEKRALLIGGGIANFTDVALTFRGIIRALKETQQKLRDANVKIFVRRGGPNYMAGLAMMRQVAGELGVPIEVYGPETSMTKIVPMAIEYVRS